MGIIFKELYGITITSELENYIEEKVKECFLNGDLRKTVKTAHEETGIDKKIINTIISTELSKMYSLKHLSSFKDLKCERIKILIAYDIKCCDECIKHDNKIVKIDDAIIGITIPPFHPGCRCVIVPKIDEDLEDKLSSSEGRSARNKLGKSYITYCKTYQEWKKEYDEE